MFKLPRLPYTRSLSSLEMTKFYGYDHTESCADGFIYDCKNISSKDFPYLTVRDKRYYIKSKDGNKIIGMSCSDELYYVTNDGQKSYFFYGDRLCGEWEDTKGSQKSFAELGRTIYIYPDKKYFRKRDDKKCEEYLKEHPKVGQQGYVWARVSSDFFGTGQDPINTNTISVLESYAYSNGIVTIYLNGKNVYEKGDHIKVWGEEGKNYSSQNDILDLEKEELNDSNIDDAQFKFSGIKSPIFNIPFDSVYSKGGNLYIFSFEDGGFYNADKIKRIEVSKNKDTLTFFKMYFEYVYPEEIYEKFGEFAEDMSGITICRDKKGDIKYDYIIIGRNFAENPDFERNAATNHYESFLMNRYSDGMYVTFETDDANAKKILPEGAYIEKVLVDRLISGFNASSGGGYRGYRALLRFPENTFKVESDAMTEDEYFDAYYMDFEGSVKVCRNIPNLENICVVNNRVWGYDGNTIYASSLGKPYEMGTYKGIASDSYALEVNMKDEFSGCASYNSMPIFFTEDRIIKIYGTDPSSFQTSETLCSGLKKGTKNGFCVCGGVLYYLDAIGQICAYTGSYPSVISKKLCDQYKNAVMCTVDDKIYFGLENLSGKKEMFVFDTTNGIWLKDDDKNVSLMSCFENKLYFVEDGSEMIITDKECDTFGTGVLFESDIDAFIEFPQTYDGVFNHKSLRRLILKIDAQEGCTIKVQIRYDNDELWTDVFEKCIEKGEGLLRVPIMPKRCTRYSIRISGKGKWRLEGILKELSIGSK